MRIAACALGVIGAADAEHEPRGKAASGNVQRRRITTTWQRAVPKAEAVGLPHHLCRSTGAEARWQGQEEEVDVNIKKPNTCYPKPSSASR